MTIINILYSEYMFLLSYSIIMSNLDINKYCKYWENEKFIGPFSCLFFRGTF
jgi:hypothetical protein